MMNDVGGECTVAYEYEDDDCDCAAEYSDVNVTEEESTWTKPIIGYLLEECLKKKKDLHDPRHRRNKFFGDIREQMLARGFFFTAKTLEKKFHNLKKHFCMICQNRDRATTPGRPITWPYYEIMMEIFAEELEIEDAPTMASLYPEPPPSKNAIIEEPKVVTKPDPDLLPEAVSPTDFGEMEVFDDGDDGTEESLWSHESVVAFLRECAKRKYELWDPQIRRRKIFNEIRQRLKAKGFNFYQESLDRKLRNMKKHFQVVTDSANRTDGNNSRRRKLTWPYYNEMKEIYGKEMEKEMSIIRRTGRKVLTSMEQPRQPLPTATTLKFRPIAPKTEPFVDEVPTEQVQFVVSVPVANHVAPIPLEIATNGELYQDQETLCERTSPGDFDRPFISGPSQEDNTSLPPTYDEDFMEKPIGFEVKIDDEVKPVTFVDEKLKFSLDVLGLEERRTIVSEKLLEEFVESNRIKQKRLEFNRIKLDYAIARGKRKKKY